MNRGDGGMAARVAVISLPLILIVTAVVCNHVRMNYVNCELVAAVGDGDIGRVSDSLLRGADPNTNVYSIDSEGCINSIVWRPRGIAFMPALVYCLKPERVGEHHGSSAIANALISHGADIEEADDAGETPLIVASRAGDSEMVVELLRRHARTSPRDKAGASALTVAGTGAVAALLSGASASAR